MAGAPFKYNAKYHDPWVFSLACDGRTEEEIAEAMAVSRQTIDRWKYVWEKRSVPVLDENGKQVIDANGNPVVKQKAFVVLGEDGEKKLSSFGERLFEGKNVADAQMEQSLFKAGTGYTVEEKEEIVEVGNDGRPKPLKIRKVTKHIPANVMAQMYWLNNRSRRNGKWSQRQDITLSVGNYDALNDAFDALKDDAP